MGRRVICVHCHPLPNRDINCSYFGQVVTKECCEECKKEVKGERFGDGRGIPYDGYYKPRRKVKQNGS